MSWNLQGLPWLLPPPPDFNERCIALRAAIDPVGDAAGALARGRLDVNQTWRLFQAMSVLSPELLSPLIPFRLGLLGDGTTDLIVPALAVAAARYGLALETFAAHYGQGAQQALDPDGALVASQPDAVLLAFDHRGLPLDDAVEPAIGAIEAMRDGIAANIGCPVILQTIAGEAAPLFGSLDLRIAETHRHRIDRFNRVLVGSLDGTSDLLLDVAAVAGAVGLDLWHDRTQWFSAKLPFAQDCVPLYADIVARLIGAVKGQTAKCLVLDLDNTIWGGVIGDDGLDGINLGQGDALGEAYLEVQKTALALRDRGILLAVCSKNDDSLARQAFREHPEMLLREEHIAVFQANWSDKASNLEAIADALNIGIDTLVLLDDNPAEREQVRQALPTVAVPELPEDPAYFPRALLWSGLFEASVYSEEDRHRTGQYQANARRAELRSSVRNLDDYLRSLEMEIAFAPFDDVGRGRIAQLINRSNQFNLTTRRYTEADLRAMESDPDIATFQVRLADRFGDNGMICVVICRANHDVWEIDSWLMSCRVLGRKVEDAVLNELVRAGRAAGKNGLTGIFRDSGRNELAHELYPKLGFLFANEEDRETRWRLDFAGYEEHPVPMTVHR